MHFNGGLLLSYLLTSDGIGLIATEDEELTIAENFCTLYVVT